MGQFASSSGLNHQSANSTCEYRGNVGLNHHNRGERVANTKQIKTLNILVWDGGIGMLPEFVWWAAKRKAWKRQPYTFQWVEWRGRKWLKASKLIWFWKQIPKLTLLVAVTVEGQSNLNPRRLTLLNDIMLLIWIQYFCFSVEPRLKWAVIPLINSSFKAVAVVGSGEEGAGCPWSNRSFGFLLKFFTVINQRNLVSRSPAGWSCRCFSRERREISTSSFGSEVTSEVKAAPG